MKTQKASSSSVRRKSRFTLLGRKKKAREIKGKLRIRSIPGAFLVLGVLVLVVGTTLAVAGYWPYISRASILGDAKELSISESQTSGWSLGAQDILSTASLIHSERMKLLGPVIMGVGLFILICANTVLYENRDRETQMLLAQMHSVICSVSAAVPSADLKEMAAENSMAKRLQWVSTLPAAHLNILCLTSSEPLLQIRRPRDQEDSTEGLSKQADLQNQSLHIQESEIPPSLPSLPNSCDSSQKDLTTEQERDARFVPHLSRLTKLNNCLVSASSMSTLEVDQVDVPAFQPRRCQSVSYRTNLHVGRTAVHHKSQEDGEINQHSVTEREAAAQVLGSTIPAEVAYAKEEPTHRSWPRLDLGGGRRYLKLENKEDSVDKLLDHLEQQYSQWDMNFGSGPFQ